MTRIFGLVINILAAKFAIKEREVYLVKPFGVAQAPRREASGFGFFIEIVFSMMVLRMMVFETWDLRWRFLAAGAFYQPRITLIARNFFVFGVA